MFTGIDGLGHAMHLLGLSQALADHATIYAFEVDERCRTVLKKRKTQHTSLIVSDMKDDDGCKGSVKALLKDNLLTALIQYHCRALAFLGVAGSPCVGFSDANPRGAGIQNQESALAAFPPVVWARMRQALDGLGLNTPIGFLFENVPMLRQPGSRQAISDTLHVEPHLLEASRQCACDRDRLYWTNVEVTDLPATEIDPKSILTAGWAPLWELVPGHGGKKRFSTFLKPFPPGRPSEFPADFWRLPLSTYSVRGLVYKTDATEADLAKVRGLIDSHVAIPTDDLKQKGSHSVRLRGELATMIHQEGLDRCLRPLNADERERALGLPGDAARLDHDCSQAWQWERMRASGNPFAPPVIAHVLGPFVRSVLKGDPPTLLSGFPTALDIDSAIASLTPVGRSQPGNQRR